MHTNSLINSVMSGNQKMPEVGMGATVLGWTDRYAATIVAVKGKDAGTVIIQLDHATRTDTNGMSDSQTYEYAPNTDAPRVTYTRRKNGHWVRQGESLKGGTRLSIGQRNHHHDFSF